MMECQVTLITFLLKFDLKVNPDVKIQRLILNCKIIINQYYCIIVKVPIFLKPTCE